MTHSNPTIAEIDAGLDNLQDVLAAFANSEAYEIQRSHEGSFNVPRRWLQKLGEPRRDVIGLIIDLPYPEKLQQGWHSAIPIQIYAQSEVRSESQSRCCHQIVETSPFDTLDLSAALRKAQDTIDDWSTEWILANGEDSSPTTG